MSDKASLEAVKPAVKDDKHESKETKKKGVNESNKALHSVMIESLRNSEEFDIERFRLEVGCEQLRKYVEEMTGHLKNLSKRELNIKWTHLNRSLDLAVDTMAMVKNDIVDGKDEFLHSKLMQVKGQVGEIQSAVSARKIQEEEEEAELEREEEEEEERQGKGRPHVLRKFKRDRR